MCSQPPMSCRHCGQTIQQVPVTELRLPSMVRTTESAERIRAEIRAEVGELVWETTETRRYTCASANVWHEPQLTTRDNR